MINFNSYTRPVHQDWERWVFYIMEKTNSKSRKLRKEKNIFPTKEHDTTPETYLNEMEISDFPEIIKISK